MVSHFPVDYMHNSCLGINKQLLKLWVDRSKISRVMQVHLNVLSDALKTVSKCIPIEFALKYFDLDNFHKWKATQHRTFLLYLGPLVLRNMLPNEKYMVCPESNENDSREILLLKSSSNKLTRKHMEVSASDLNELLICCSTGKNKGHIFFYTCPFALLGGETPL
jgi:hypothetical protein